VVRVTRVTRVVVREVLGLVLVVAAPPEAYLEMAVKEAVICMGPKKAVRPTPKDPSTPPITGASTGRMQQGAREA